MNTQSEIEETIERLSQWQEWIWDKAKLSILIVSY
jgi:hypothetical protein